MKIRKILESVASAVAFAESGGWETALDVLHKDHTAKKVLVAYEGDHVNRRLIEYALGVAQRVRCEIHFAYVHTMKRAEELSLEHMKNMNAAFMEAFEHEVEMMQVKCESPSWNFITSSDFNETVHTICSEVPNIEFAIIAARMRRADALNIGVPYFYFK